MPPIDNALRLQIRPLEQDDTPFSLMQNMARALNRGGGGGRGSREPKSVPFFNAETGTYDWVLDTGNKEQNQQSWENMRLYRARAAVYGDADKQIAGDEAAQKKIQAMQGASVEKQAEILQSLRTEDIPRIAKARGVGASDLIKVLTPQAENLAAQQQAIENQSAFGTFLDSARMGFGHFTDSIQNLVSDADEQMARAQARQESDNAIIQENAVLRNRALRQQEGADFMDRMGSGVANELAATVGEFVGANAPMLAAAAVTAPIGGGLAGALGAGARGVAIARGLGAAASTAPLSAGMQLQSTVEEIANDPNLSDAQKQQALDDAYGPSVGLGAATGALVFPLGASVNRAIGTGLAGLGIGRSQLARTTREAVRNIGRTPAGVNAEALAGRSYWGAARQSAHAADVAADNVRLAESRFARYRAGLADTALEGGLYGGISQAGTNYIIGEATGQPRDITEGLGEAIAAGVASAPVLGLLNTRRPRIVPRTARDANNVQIRYSVDETGTPHYYDARSLTNWMNRQNAPSDVLALPATTTVRPDLTPPGAGPAPERQQFVADILNANETQYRQSLRDWYAERARNPYDLTGQSSAEAPYLVHPEANTAAAYRAAAERTAFRRAQGTPGTPEWMARNAARDQAGGMAAEIRASLDDARSTVDRRASMRREATQGRLYEPRETSPAAENASREVFVPLRSTDDLLSFTSEPVRNLFANTRRLANNRMDSTRSRADIDRQLNDIANGADGYLDLASAEANAARILGASNVNRLFNARQRDLIRYIREQANTRINETLGRSTPQQPTSGSQQPTTRPQRPPTERDIATWYERQYAPNTRQLALPNDVGRPPRVIVDTGPEGRMNSRMGPTEIYAGGTRVDNPDVAARADRIRQREATEFNFTRDELNMPEVTERSSTLRSADDLRPDTPDTVRTFFRDVRKAGTGKTSRVQGRRIVDSRLAEMDAGSTRTGDLASVQANSRRILNATNTNQYFNARQRDLVGYAGDQARTRLMQEETADAGQPVRTQTRQAEETAAAPAQPIRENPDAVSGGGQPTARVGGPDDGGAGRADNANSADRGGEPQDAATVAPVTPVELSERPDAVGTSAPAGRDAGSETRSAGETGEVERPAAAETGNNQGADGERGAGPAARGDGEGSTGERSAEPAPDAGTGNARDVADAGRDGESVPLAGSREPDVIEPHTTPVAVRDDATVSDTTRTDVMEGLTERANTAEAILRDRGVPDRDTLNEDLFAAQNAPRPVEEAAAPARTDGEQTPPVSPEEAAAVARDPDVNVPRVVEDGGTLADADAMQVTAESARNGATSAAQRPGKNNVAQRSLLDLVRAEGGPIKGTDKGPMSPDPAAPAEPVTADNITAARAMDEAAAKALEKAKKHANLKTPFPKKSGSGMQIYAMRDRLEQLFSMEGTDNVPPAIRKFLNKIAEADPNEFTYWENPRNRANAVTTALTRYNVAKELGFLEGTGEKWRDVLQPYEFTLGYAMDLNGYPSVKIPSADINSIRAAINEQGINFSDAIDAYIFNNRSDEIQNALNAKTQKVCR